MSEVPKRPKIDEDCEDPTTLIDLNLKLLNDLQDCNLFFLVGPEREKIGAHKHILKKRSSYFRVRLSGRWGNSSNPDSVDDEILLENEKPPVFRAFLQHIYAYVFNPAGPVEAVELLSLAKYFDVKTLVKSCEEFLAKPFQPDQLLSVFVTAKGYHLTDVMAKAGQTMANYFPQLVNSPSFEKADEATLIYLLERDDLSVEESELFSVLLRWADKQIENSAEIPKPGRTQVLKNLLPLVRFPTMSAHEFAEVVALTNILPIDIGYNLFLYYMLCSESRLSARRAVASTFPFSTVPRKNAMECIQFYTKHPSPGTGTYPNVALRKCSNIQDTITFKFGREPRSQNIRIVSLILERPRYGEPLFQNSLEVAGLDLPIRVAVSVSETERRGGPPTWTSEEVFADIGSGPVVVTLDTPWEISPIKLNRISVRFLSDVYALPEVVQDGAGHQCHRIPGDEPYDFFTSTKLRHYIHVPRTTCWIQLLSLSGGGAGSAADVSASQATSLSSGLHLIRSIQVAYA